jgi:hypothetical protein
MNGPCDASTWETKLQTMNMLPELIRMTCSMVGAWGSATPDGKLTQLRTLDFGGGPFVNHTVLAVHFPSEGGAVPFAAISFSGLVGVVSGFSQHIGMSEKVRLFWASASALFSPLFPGADSVNCILGVGDLPQPRRSAGHLRGHAGRYDHPRDAAVLVIEERGHRRTHTRGSIHTTTWRLGNQE